MQVNVKYIKRLKIDLLGQSNHGNEDGARSTHATIIQHSIGY